MNNIYLELSIARVYLADISGAEPADSVVVLIKIRLRFVRVLVVAGNGHHPSADVDFPAGIGHVAHAIIAFIPVDQFDVANRERSPNRPDRAVVNVHQRAARSRLR